MNQTTSTDQASEHSHPPHRKRLAAALKLLVPVAALTLTLSACYSASGSGWTVWDDMAQCESGGNWSTNTGNGYYGGLQFSASTWEAQGGGEFAPTADQATREQQIIVAERLLAAAGWGQWPHCSSQLGLR